MSDSLNSRGDQAVPAVLSAPDGFEVDASLVVETSQTSGVFYSVKPNANSPTVGVGSTVAPASFTPSFLRTADIEPAHAAGDQFDIEIVYSGDASYQWAFERSAERWEELLTGDLPDTFMGSGSVPVESFNDGSLIDDLSGETIDDIRIYATIEPIDGENGVLGAAGPYYLRASGDELPVVGVMVFDSDDVVGLASSGSLQSTILHEMGHVLGGLDYYWQLNNHQGADNTTEYFQYNGGSAFNAYSTTYSGSDSFIEIEADGGPGTAGSHWDEAVFGRELMTGFLNGGERGEQLSAISIGMFEDIGYTVDYSRVDAYRIFSELGASTNEPVFTSYGGVQTAAIEMTEGETAAAQAETNDPDISFQGLNSISVDEAVSGTVYTAEAAYDRVTYQIYLGDDRDLFRVDAVSGAISFVSPPSAALATDSNGDGVYSVQVRATDGYNYGLQAYDISVVEDAQASSRVENNLANESSITFSLGTAGGDEGAFALTSSGALSFITAPDYEDPADANDDNVYQVELVAADGQGGTATKQIAITVQDVLESNLTTIEAIGDVTLSRDDSNYLFVTDASGTVGLTSSRGVPIRETSRVSGRHAEENDQGGYIALFEDYRGRFTVRNFDAEGEEVGRTKSVRRESDLVDLEETFETDLNNDDVIGHTYTLIEDAGDVTLSSSTTGGYSINDLGEGEVSLLDTRGRVIQQNSRYDFLHAEEDGEGGYDVLIQSYRGQYSVRQFDGTGREDARALSVRNEAELVSLEETFEVDLNDDDVIGHTYTLIESTGDVALSSSTSGGYSINDQGGGEVGLKDGGGRVILKSPAFSFLHAEEDGEGGYDVLMQSSRGQYSVRQFNASGREDGRTTPVRSEAELVSLEERFEVDLNDDDVIGHTKTVIESVGDVALSSSTTGGYLFNDQGAGDVSLLDNRGRLIQQSNRWDFLHVEEDNDGGYDVLIVSNRGQYLVRQFDGTGWEDDRPMTIRTEAELVSQEETFEVDLNDDDVIGHTYTLIENTGDVTLSSSTSGGYSINDQGAGELSLTSGRGRIIPQSSSYALLHAEEDGEGGYDVLMQSSRGTYSVRQFDANGREDARAVTLRTESDLVSQEETFEIDLNDDDVIGHTYTVIEDNGDVALSSATTGGYTVNDGSGEMDLLSSRGTLAKFPSRIELLATEENDDNGFSVLAAYTTRNVERHLVYNFNEDVRMDGRPEWLRSDADYQAWEAVFDLDIDGDDFIGPPLPLTASDDLI